MKTKKICSALGIFFISIVLILIGLLCLNNTSSIAYASTLKSEQIRTATQSTSSPTKWYHDGADRDWYIYSGNMHYIGYGEGNFAHHSTTVSYWIEGTHSNPVLKINLNHRGIPWQRGWEGSNGQCYYELSFGNNNITGNFAVDYSGDDVWRDESTTISFPSEYLDTYSYAYLSVRIKNSVYQPVPCSYFNLQYRYLSLQVSMPTFQSNNQRLNYYPTGQASGIDYYNQKDLKYTWTENLGTSNTTHAVTTTLNGSTYRSGTVIPEGQHTLIFKNCNTTITHNFVVDYTAPQITMKKSGSGAIFSDGDTINDYPIFTVKDNYLNSVVIKNNATGKTYNWSDFATSTVYYDNRESGSAIKYRTSRDELKAYLLEKEMSQFVEYLNNYTANESEHIYNDDERNAAKIGAPYYRYYYTTAGKNGDYKVFFTKSVLSNFINSNTNNYISSIKNQVFTEEGNFTITATDKASNSTSKTFTIDTTAPSGTLNGVANGGITNTDVSFTWTESGATATLNGVIYNKGTPISSSGSYKLKLSDKSGNYTIYTFTINKNAPNGTLIGVEDGGVTSTDVTFTWSVSDATATLDGQSYTKGDAISTEGLHTIILRDILGNERKYTFEIDRTAPVGELSGVENDGITNTDVSFAWTEIGATATLDGQPYIKGNKITSEGKHIVKLTDAVGNTTTYTFTIDKTAPVGKLNGVEVEGITNSNVSFTWSEQGATATLDGQPYTKGSFINTEGHHTIILSDNIGQNGGNKTTYTFTIDKTAPVGELVGVENGGITNGNVLFGWTESGATATLDGSSYASGTVISVDNNTQHQFTIILQDSVNNQREYTFTIDKIAPTGKLNGVVNGGATNSDVTFTWTESGATATLNLLPYSPNTVIRAEGDYSLILRDVAGNTMTYTFTIDKTAPVGEFSNNGNVVNGTHYFNSDVSFICSELNAYAEITLNRTTSSYLLGSTISAEGSYTIKLYDAVSNCIEYPFVIDKTPYLTNRDYLQKNYLANISKWYETYDYKFNESRLSYVINQYYSFTNQSDTLRYAYNRERGIVEEGIYKGGSIYCSYNNNIVTQYDIANISSYLNHTYYIYKSNNNPNELKVYFNVANLENALNKYANNSVTVNYIPATPATPFGGDENVGAQAVLRDTIFINSTSFTLPYPASDVVLYINGKESSYDSTLTLGLNYIEEIDFAGNSITYSVILDIEQPHINCTNLQGTYIPEFEQNLNTPGINEFYFDSGVILSLTDNYDTSCVLKITFNKVTTYYINESCYLTETGVYTFQINDVAGNIKQGTIYISIEQPEFNVIENLDEQARLRNFNLVIDKKDSFVSLANLSISLKEIGSDEYIGIVADLDGKEISTNTLKYLFVKNGDYLFQLSDNFGRTVTLTYTFVSEAPIGTLCDDTGAALGNKKITNRKVYFTWTDTTCRAFYSINGGEEVEYGNNKPYLSEDGDYVITLKAPNGKESIYTFTIDTVAPTGKLYYLLDEVEYELRNNGKTNSFVRFDYNKESELNATVVYSTNGGETWSTYENGYFTIDATYIVKLTDAAGNTKNFNFTIDSIPPEVQIKTDLNNLLSNNMVTNHSVRFVWSENNCNATLNNETYKSGTLIHNEGKYTFNLIDECGNFVTLYVTIDKTAPVGELSGVENGGITNTDVTFTWEETKAIVTLNGQPYTKGDTIKVEGLHTILLSDIAGNTTTYTFTIDKTAPVGELSGVTNGGITNNNVSFTWTESGATATLNGVIYNKRNLIAEEGAYTLILCDTANNERIYTFTIDKTAPVGELVGVENGGITNNSVYFIWTEEGVTATLNNLPYISETELTYIGTYKLILADVAGNTTTYTFTIDKIAPVGELVGVENGGITNNNVYFTWTESGATATLDGQSYSKRNYISSEGEHVIVLTSLANNSSIYTFTIDKTAPVGELSGVTNGGITNNNVYLTWVEDDVTATINSTPYYKNTVITAENIYKIVLSDVAGNTTTYSFTIDKTAPVGELSGVTNGGITNNNVSFTWTEQGATATLDGQPYSKRNYISSEGKHIVKLSDVAGNTTTYTFTIDKTAPVGELVGVENGGVTNTEVYLMWVEDDVTATINGQNYTSATIITEAGDYSIQLIDRASNKTYYTFSIVYSFPEGKLIGVENGGITNTDVSFIWTEDDCTVLLNDAPYSKGSIISDSGNYLILLVNNLGTTTEYTFTIDKTAPNGTLIGVEDGGITNTDVSFEWVEEGAYATLNNLAYESGSSITSEGQYVVKLSDVAGNTTTYTFTIDKTAPVGELVGVENGGITMNSVMFSWTEEGATAKLNTIDYISGKSINEDAYYTLILSDDAGNYSTYTFTISSTLLNGTLINVEDGGTTNLDVSFIWTLDEATATLDGSEYVYDTNITSEGTHQIILSFGSNSKMYTFTIDKTAPVGELVGVENGGVTNTEVVFTWAEQGATATLNGETYRLKSKISTEGLHTIVLSDALGNQNIYTFTIDKTAPVGELVGTSNKGYTNTDVSFIWTEEGAYATLNDEEYVKGNNITSEGEHVVKLTDVAGNTTTYTFTIDKTAPTFSGVENGAKLNTSVTINFEVYCTATVEFLAENSDVAQTKKYTSTIRAIENGLYTISIEDLASNITTIQFEIYIHKPDVIIAFENEEKNLSDLSNNRTYTVTEAFSLICDGDYTFIINDKAYSKGTPMSDIGLYQIECSDSYGNVLKFNVELIEQSIGVATEHNPTVANVILIILAIVAVIALVVRIVLGKVKKKREFRK